MQEKPLIRPPIKPSDRRRAMDFWTRLFIFLSFMAWGILVASLVVFHRAQPEFETFFDRFYRLNLRTTWDLQFLKYLAYTVILGLAVSVFSFALSLSRARRRTDHKNHLLILAFLYLVLMLMTWFFS